MAGLIEDPDAVYLMLRARNRLALLRAALGPQPIPGSAVKSGLVIGDLDAIAEALDAVLGPEESEPIVSGADLALYPSIAAAAGVAS